MKKGILLINLGTPKSPSVKDVRIYLRQFFSDRRVIDASSFVRFMIRNLVPLFRAPKSAKIYQAVWTGEGSPLLVHGMAVKNKLQNALGENYVVAIGMGYQEPSIKKALQNLKDQAVEDITIVPLFPQYAAATNASINEGVMKELQNWEVIPSFRFINKFYDHPLFIEAFYEVGKNYLHEDYDHVLFSYHGLPERQILKASKDFGKDCCQLNDACCARISKDNQYCYRAACYHTTRELVKKINIPEGKYSICFQSRFGKDPWIQPYAEDVIREQGKKGARKLLVYSPAFVADCIETIYEIGVEYKEIFLEEGGQTLHLVESLNSHPKWIEALKAIVASP